MHRTAQTRGFSRVQAATGQRPGQLAVKITVSILIAAGFAMLLRARLQTLDLTDVAIAFATVSPLQWGLAVLATGLSFWAVGQYDATLHRHFRSPLPGRITSRAGIAAVAVSQTLGLGVVTGALLRWRMLPGSTLWQATRLTIAVTASFLAGWVVVTSLVLLWLPLAPFKAIAGCVLLVALPLAIACLAAPPLQWQGRPLHWPNGFILGRILALTAIDTLAAAMALYALCPPDLALPFVTLLPAFLIALGAGLVSGTPGGVGAFEVTLIALLPGQPDAQLLAAILAYRAVYYAIPAAIGVAMAVRGAAPAADCATLLHPAHPDLAQTAPQAEAQLTRQRALGVLSNGTTTIVAGRTAHSLVALRDPLFTTTRRDGASALRALIRTARAEGRLPCLYKCGPRMAATARGMGLTVLRIAHEGFLDPRRFATATPARSGLRRKLRKAEAAGVRITTGPLPVAAMTRLADAWVQRRGGERGFSMGRYCPQYMQGQRVYLAWVNGDLVAFASFHAGPAEWALDLMRHSAGAPDGTMQSMIIQAIADAARQNIPRLSLAAVPATACSGSEFKPSRLLAVLARAEGGGLAQFKAGFDPHWEPLYIAAPSWLSLPLCAAEIAGAILRPAPLQSACEPADMRVFHHHHAQYEFASARIPWHRIRN